MAALTVVVTACGSGGSTTGGGRGEIVGQVLAGPTCPVERADSPCPPRAAVGARVTAATTSGDVVATGRTASDGSFTITVAAGHYRVTATSAGPLATTATTAVDVPRGATVHLQLLVDTGIR